MARRVFVTGSHGRVGQRLVAALVSRGDTVVGLARSEDQATAVRALGATCLVGDLAAQDVVSRGLEGAEQVYHLAGGLRGPGKETADIINRVGMESLLAAVGRVGTKTLSSLVFTSSCAVYGNRSGLVVDEEMPAQPDTRYGQSKVDAERLLQAAEQQGVPGRIARLAAVYGPGFPFMMVDQIKAGRARLPGEGRNYVPTIHVDDAVAALILMADSGQDGATYNVADPTPVLLKAFYDQVHALVGGQPVWFWSTWVPSYVQDFAARLNERIQSHTPRRPMFTPDNLKLFRGSVRMRVDKLESELSMTWKHPDPLDGLKTVLDVA
ncbi:MAG: NAD-dependent epimerase/dehydratase family protein [Oligoflexia bacterium]|nr:NAD-dependent epimerase/dehydratase family protein [Oligoflexia bacterium]